MKLKLFSLAVIITLFSATPSFATENNLNPQVARSNDIQVPGLTGRPSTPSATGRQNRCDLIVQRLDKRVQNYNTRKDLHIAVYQRLHDRLVGVAQNLASHDLDTAKLTTDLVTLQSMIQKLSSSFQVFVTNLESTKNQACYLTIDQLKTNLANARTQLQGFRTESKAIQDFIKTTIRPDLVALRQQLAKVTPTPTPVKVTE